MKTIKKILFPTDFSAMAKEAFEYALKVAEKVGATLDVIHVFRGDFGVPVPEVMAYKLLDARKKDSERLLREFIEAGKGNDDPPANITVQNRAEMGLPGDVIIDLVDREGYDLVVMGTKGEHNVAEVIFGSVTSYTIRHAKCPVLAIPEGAKFEGVKQLAYATVLSKDNQETIGEVSDLAALLGAPEVHCVHIKTSNADESAQLKEFEKLLGEKDNGVKIDLVEVENASVEEGLNSYVEEKGIDILVMLRPQRNLLERIFYRSSTKRMALNTQIPLIVFKQG